MSFTHNISKVNFSVHSQSNFPININSFIYIEILIFALLQINLLQSYSRTCWTCNHEVRLKSQRGHDINKKVLKQGVLVNEAIRKNKVDELVSVSAGVTVLSVATGTACSKSNSSSGCDNAPCHGQQSAQL